MDDMRSAFGLRVVQSRSVTDAKQRRKKQFIIVPIEWADRLDQACHACTFKLALALLHRHWKAGSNEPVLLPNVGLGVSPGTKWRGLVELESLGLVTIERRARKSPRVTILNPPGDGIA